MAAAVSVGRRRPAGLRTPRRWQLMVTPARHAGRKKGLSMLASYTTSAISDFARGAAGVSGVAGGFAGGACSEQA